MKQLAVLEQIMNRFNCDSALDAVLLMGSVATGKATPSSDLDLLVLGSETRFETEIVDEVMVEYSFTTYESAVAKLNSNDMDVYHYMDSTIIKDIHGRMNALQSLAQQKYENYRATKEEKRAIYHWLASTKIKLISSNENEDWLKSNFLAATNSYKVLEAVWAINDKPVPPSSKIIPGLDKLNCIPYENWFESMFLGDDHSRMKSMLKIIEWALPLLRCSR
jgi:predicted nucleotidyltransferase